MNPRHLAIKILKRIDETEAFADIVINNELERTDLSARDRAFVNEIVNGSIKWRGLLDWWISNLCQGKCPANIKYILEISFYQLNFLDKIPEYAAINEGVSLARKFKGEFWAKKVNAILRNFLRDRDKLNYPEINKNPALYLATKYSHPKWLIERWIKRYGINETEKLCVANNQTPSVSLRVNQIKSSVFEVQQLLQRQGIKTQRSEYLPEFLTTKYLPRLATFEPFQQGFFSIQDESAGFVAHLLDPQPGDVVLDLCAAPGGKTTHLAELTRGKAFIIAVDIYEKRLSLIQQNIARLNLSNIKLINADATQFSLVSKIDKILIDAPCSGLGVLSKRSDLRWQRTGQQIVEMVNLQQKLLSNAVSLLKKGGVLVYSTCTIEPEENEKLVEDFLADNLMFKIDNPAKFVNSKVVFKNKYIYTYPHIHGIDGSFAVRLIRE